MQWKDGNISRAQALYQQASTNDQTDAESHIYSENASILLSNQPYDVIAVGSSFSGAEYQHRPVCAARCLHRAA